MFDQLAIRTSEGSDLRGVGKSDPDGAVAPFGHCVLGIRLRQGQLEAFRSLTEKKKLFSRSHPNGTPAIHEHILSVIDEVPPGPVPSFPYGPLQSPQSRRACRPDGAGPVASERTDGP